MSFEGDRVAVVDLAEIDLARVHDEADELLAALARVLWERGERRRDWAAAEAAVRMYTRLLSGRYEFDEVFTDELSPRTLGAALVAVAAAKYADRNRP